MKILRRLKCNRIAWQVSDSFDFKYLNFSLSASVFCLFKFVLMFISQWLHVGLTLLHKSL